MNQLSLFAPLSVEELTTHIKALLESDTTLQDVWVEGEVSNFSRPQSGHCYFSLKDAASQIRCVMWRSTAARLARLPEDGQKVLVHGAVGVYEQQGVYQLYVNEVLPTGIGELYVLFERLKTRLRDEGLFAEERKRPLPPYPRRIGIVTSPTGAALRDILHVLRRRFPCVEVTLAPTPVQGAEAPDQIAAAIGWLNEHTECDVLIVARGGGSLEELQPFNDERVARAIHGSRIPVVSGVGHETDLTIADMVADRRAPTPSAAAEVATPERADLLGAIREGRSRLARAVAESVQSSAERLSYLTRALERASPIHRVNYQRQQVDERQRRMIARCQGAFSRWNLAAGSLAKRLDSLNPDATLARGYSIVSLERTEDVVSSCRQVESGDRIAVRVSDGQFGGQVTEKPCNQEAQAK